MSASPAQPVSSLARLVRGPAYAPTLVLLHGIMGAALSQGQAVEHWAAQGYRVIALDARGHGLSPRWSPQERERAGEVLVDDVVATLEEIAEERQGRQCAGLPAAPPPVLVGHSMGAATAMVVAGRHPELVSGVVLGDPARYGSRSPEELRARGRARVRALDAELADPAASLNRSVTRTEMPESEAVSGLWATQQVDRSFLHTGVVAPEVYWEKAMAALKVPTLLLTGDRPGAARVGARGLERLKALGNPWVSAVLVPGAGHDVRRTRPESFYHLVDPWLEDLLGG